MKLLIFGLCLCVLVVSILSENAVDTSENESKGGGQGFGMQIALLPN